MCYWSQLHALNSVISYLKSIVQQSNHKCKSCVGMSSEQVCVKVWCVTATAQLKSTVQQFLRNACCYFGFLSQTIMVSGYYGIEIPLPYILTVKLLLPTSPRSNRPLWRDQIMCPQLQLQQIQCIQNLREATTSCFRPATNFSVPSCSI